MARQKREQPLLPHEQALLGEILDRTWSAGAPVDAWDVLSDHPGDKDTLRDLEVKTLLAREGRGYYVPILGLAALRSPLSRTILAHGNKLAEELRRRFHDRVLREGQFGFSEIAQHLGISGGECSLVLLHLKESVENWSGGRSADWPGENSWILPSARILDWPTIEDLVRQLKEWRMPHFDEVKSTARKGASLTMHGGFGVHPTSWIAPSPSVPEWHRDLRPGSLRSLFAEIHRARQVECHALVVLGLRSALDAMCNDMWGDLGSFQSKIQKLADEGMIGLKQRKLIEAAVEVGNATTHRGHIPSRRDAEAVYDIVEALLKQHYSLGTRASSAASRVPARAKAKKAPVVK
jgi:hypothetical protein